MVVMAALCPQHTLAGTYEREAARAELEQIVGELSREYSVEGLRVNGLLITLHIRSPRAEFARLQGPLGFLLAGDSREVVGQTLVVYEKEAVTT
jgi:hypothetical protein